MRYSSEMAWYYLHDEDMMYERIERTADIWDKIAEEFFAEHGWTKPHMAYNTDRETLWVLTDYDNHVWEDTGISSKEGDWLLCEMWDEAEYVGFQEWLEEQQEEE